MAMPCNKGLNSQGGKKHGNEIAQVHNDAPVLRCNTKINYIYLFYKYEWYRIQINYQQAD